MRNHTNTMLRSRHPIGNRALRSHWIYDLDSMLGAAESPAGFSPPLDIHEYEEHYELHFDVPGVTKEAVEIEYADGTLSVQGSRNVDLPEGAKSIRSGRRGGSFHQRIQIGEEIEVGRIEAEVADGVLSVHVPKSERAKPRQIPVAVN